MNQTKLKTQLIKHEGRRDKIYKDSVGLLTGGIGHLIQGPEKSIYKTVGQVVAPFVIEKWFKDDVNKAIEGAQRLVPMFNVLPDVRQRAIVDLVFNLGEGGLSKFVNTLAFINSGQWDNAADNLEKSLWYKQVKSRGVEIVAMIRDEKDCV